MAIEKAGDSIFNTAPTGIKTELAPDAPVSMNFWGFPPSIFPSFKLYFENFLREEGKELKSECYLPRAVDWFIKNDFLHVRVLRADSEWFGITYKEDRELAVNHIKELTAKSVYPSSLWK
jgi:hypothetical protein